MRLDIPIHTVIMMVGPTMCGKSYLSKILDNKLSATGLRCQTLSSDTIRRELIGVSDIDKHSHEMMSISEQAFNLLEVRLNAHISYPVNTEFVIVDSTGMSETFRNKVTTLAKENEYNVIPIIFDYKSRNDFIEYTDNPKLVMDAVKRLKRKVLPTLHKRQFKTVYTIKERIEDVEVTIPRLGLYTSCFVNTSKGNVIGDLHEREDLLQDLIKKLKSSNGPIIMVGDYLDKNHRTRETIEFLYANRNRFYFVDGNHDAHHRLVLSGNKDENRIPEDILKKYFTASEVLKTDVELQRKFLELSKQFRPFIKGNGFVVTHAPTKLSLIGKVSNKAIKSQCYIFISNKTQNALHEFLNEHVFNTASNHLPWYFFGHISFNKVLRYKNIFGVDTGAGQQSKLSAVVFDAGRKSFYVSVGTYNPNSDKIFSVDNMFPKKEVNFQDLNNHEKRILQYVTENGVNYISGTMSPPASDKNNNKLETLDSAFSYYRNKNVTKCILEPKYMGNRVSVYLHRDISQCYATTRKGYRVKADLTTVYEDLLKKHRSFMDSKNLAMIIWDGELLPWSIIGKGLIDDKFKPLIPSVKTEIDFLKSSGMLDKIKETLNSLPFEKFNYDAAHTSKKNLIREYGPNYDLLKHFNTVKKMTSISLSEHHNWINIYQKQMELYGQDGKLEYKPFAVLKYIYNDGTEEVRLDKGTNEEHFTFSNDGPYFVVDLNDASSVQRAKKFYYSLTVEKGFEGVVIKPYDAKFNVNVAPYMKVRNSQYLTIIYGYDYLEDENYKQMVNRKNVHKKISTSINEYRLGLEMLKTPLTGLNSSEFRQITANILFEVRSEQNLDPRL